MLLKNVFSLILFTISLTVHADELPRLGKLSYNKRDVQKIYIAEGRSTILKFPCNVKTFSQGPTNDIEATLNERDSQLLEVWLGKPHAQPAGLKVFCNESYFAFDIIPSTVQHQDVLEIKSSYGTAKTISIGIKSDASKIIASSSGIRPKTQNIKVLRVISSSSGVTNEK